MQYALPGFPLDRDGVQEPLRTELAKTGVASVRPGSDGISLLEEARLANGERIFVSTLRERVKAKDIERRGWAALSVRGEEPPYPSATFTGSAVVRTAGIGEDTALVMGRIAGLPEPPEPQSDEALAEAGRVLVEITVERVAAAMHV